MIVSISIERLLNKYALWVCSNPNLVADMETLATWSSYFIAGKINSSPIVSELVYSFSKLLTLFNDRIFENSLKPDRGGLCETRESIEIFITLLDYCKVFLELTTRLKWGNRGKWNIATGVQTVKCVLSLVLLYKYKQLPILHPPLPHIQRKNLLGEKCKTINDEGFVLKRSGRVVRKVDGAPSPLVRNWQPLEDINLTKVKNDNFKLGNLRIAESLYIMKPIIHLGSVACFGSENWSPWLISLGIDLTSLKMYSKYIALLSYEQRIEIIRRKLNLILYLLRSPMYNKHSREIIKRFLQSIYKAIPLTGFLVNPLSQYLNYWQDIYFYMWSS